MRHAVSRRLEGVRKSSLVFWKGLVALPDMSATDVSFRHVSSLSGAEQCKIKTFELYLTN